MDRPSPVKSPRAPFNRTFYLPRLPREYYQGDATVHWTLTIAHRAKGWLSTTMHHQFRELMFHAAAREGLLCPIYCLMPDHIHLVWMGLRRDSDQHNGMSFLRTQLKPLLRRARLQHQGQDNVLREEDRQRNAFARVCLYIAANPVRAELMNATDAWPYTGCIVPGYPTFNPMEETFWPLFWKIYHQMRQPDVGNINRPPLK